MESFITPIDPVLLFQEWYGEELRQSKVAIPTACCLSTIGLDGYPNARFVALKEVSHAAFIVTGPINARKGLEIERVPKVALTFWWAETERQVRVQGDATKVSDADADRYFRERPREAQIVSCVSRQGREIEDPELLHKKYQQESILLEGKHIERPKDWGGFAVNPIRIEFLDFQAGRFHERRLFSRTADGWVKQLLQP